MRYEQLTHAGKMKTLKRMHRFINKHFFNNSLRVIPLDIENISKEEDLSGLFGVCDIPGFPYPEKISISHELEKDIEKMKTQKEQVLLLGTILLHEAIHQYCYENGIEDENHAGQWKETAKEHGLISIYEDGTLIEEHLTITAYITMQSFRIV